MMILVQYKYCNLHVNLNYSLSSILGNVMINNSSSFIQDHIGLGCVRSTNKQWT